MSDKPRVDLFGIDPGYTGDLSTEEYLAKVHGELPDPLAEHFPATVERVRGTPEFQQAVTAAEGATWDDPVDLDEYLAKIRGEDPPETLENAVFQAVGAASACWDNLAGAGVFQSEQAIKVAEELLAKIRAYYVAALRDAGMLREPRGNGDVPCPKCGELVNVRCWKCGTPREDTP